ncbi:MAG: hypothetical protein V3U28_05895 [Candidatus Acidoferrales bacterium]
MAQCEHLNANGRRCPQEADDGRAFCLRHEPGSPIHPSVRGRSLRRWAFRLAALLLLTIFLIPLLVQAYRIVRALIR